MASMNDRDRNIVMAGAALLVLAAVFLRPSVPPAPPSPDVPAPVPVPVPPAPPAPPVLTLHEELIAAHNKRRVPDRQLVRDENLMKVAQAWADSMAAKQRMVHQSLSKLGDWRTCGENIARSQTSVDEVMQVWMGSPGHHRNIVYKGYTHIGVGMAKARDGTPYWCVDFGGRDTGEPLPDWGSTQPDFYGEETPVEGQEPPAGAIGISDGTTEG